MKKLLSVSSDAKTSKGQVLGVLTGIMYLSPGSLSGKNLCAFAGECLKLCLNTAGRGAMNFVQKARLERTHRFLGDTPKAIQILKKEIVALEKKAKKNGLIPAVRFNGTSDLPFENLFPMEEFPNVNFYDYTKNPFRMARFLEGKMPKNYHLTFSLSETNEAIALSILKQGGNVAAVFGTRNPEMFPKTWHGFPVINGDLSDIRFNDPKGSVVALKMKGKATKDVSGFVQPIVSPATAENVLIAA